MVGTFLNIQLMWMKAADNASTEEERKAYTELSIQANAHHFDIFQTLVQGKAELARAQTALEMEKYPEYSQRDKASSKTLNSRHLTKQKSRKQPQPTRQPKNLRDDPNNCNIHSTEYIL